MRHILFYTWTSILILCALALGAWFRTVPQLDPPNIKAESPQPNSLYLPFISVPAQWLGPEGGMIAAVVASPQDPNRVYAGSWGGGVYRSDDGGFTWRWASRGLANLTVVSLALDPTNTDILFAGTYHGGAYKTTDGGGSWFPANQGIQSQAIVYSVVIDPQNTQWVYAATRGLSNNGNPPWAGVTYRSTDGGGSWSVSLSDLGGSAYQDWTYMLAISQTSPTTLMAATHEHGILRTTNSGDNWRAVNSGMSNFTTRAIGIGPISASANTAYTGVWTGSGVFKTTNMGNSWTQKSSGISGAHIYRLDIDPSNPQRVYLATYNMGVMSTSNGGNAWSNTALPGLPVSTVLVHPGNSMIVFAGSAGLGLYASRDSGASWSPSQAGLQATSVTSVIVSPSNPDELYAGVDGGGVQRSIDRGLTRSDFSQGIGSPWVNGLIQQPGSSVLYTFTEDAGLYRCDLQNPTACWERVGTNLPTSSQTQVIQPDSDTLPPNLDTEIRLPQPFSPYVTFLEAYPPEDPDSIQTVPGNYGLLAMAFAPSDPEIAYIGSSSGGAFASNDGGLTWHDAGLSPEAVWALAIDPLDPQKVYAATSQVGTVNISTNGGSSWSNSSIPGRTVYALAMSPIGVPLAGTDDGVYMLSGSSWQLLGLPGFTIAWITIDPADPNHILAGTTDGSFSSHNGGLSWQPYPIELRGHTVQQISLDPFNPGVAYYSTTAHGAPEDKQPIVEIYLLPNSIASSFLKTQPFILHLQMPVNASSRRIIVELRAIAAIHANKTTIYCWC